MQAMAAAGVDIVDMPPRAHRPNPVQFKGTREELRARIAAAYPGLQPKFDALFAGPAGLVKLVNFGEVLARQLHAQCIPVKGMGLEIYTLCKILTTKRDNVLQLAKQYASEGLSNDELHTIIQEHASVFDACRVVEDATDCLLWFLLHHATLSPKAHTFRLKKIPACKAANYFAVLAGLNDIFTHDFVRGLLSGQNGRD